MLKREKYLVIILVVSLLAVVISTVTAIEAQSSGEVGRYQVATDFWDAGNWIYVTVIDTTTGEIVKRERHSGKAYGKPK